MAARNTKVEGNLFEAIQQFSADKGLTRESVMNVIKDSLVAAYRKKLNLLEPTDEDTDISVEFLSDSNEVVILINKTVTENPSGPLEISIEDAKKIDDSVEYGSKVLQKEKPIDFSRIISSHARQMVFQKLKEMEREILYNEYKAKEGELTHGYFQRWKNKDVMSIDLGKIEGIMPKKEQNPGEKYHTGDRMKAIISKVELKREKSKEPGPFITLSRASADFVKKLFEMEIPEIYDGIVTIVDIARIPSIRTKIVVAASRNDIDPVGACVGMKGVRIQSIVRELGNERIDIVQYSDDPIEFITNAISPAKPLEVRVDNEGSEALVIVSDDSLSLAIGTSGSNVKLASQLTQYKIDIKSISQFNEDMTSPEAREKLDKLFSAETKEEKGTPLEDIPGLTSRVIGLLTLGGIKDVETLIEMDTESLAKIPGVGQTTAEHISRLLSESVEWVE
ncbi:MAG: transcription termination factor NusA [Leptospiraceae bacterium]|nr:transcription termination/antitermination protein NusA [Leptospiraceae bacterium]MCK6379756.1 transcription termination factor NusA [Leptospiraceae bacterium]NUM40412.1 transcription termination/antitermination protein NusA [Leptospiraceae bacterium]